MCLLLVHFYKVLAKQLFRNLVKLENYSYEYESHEEPASRSHRQEGHKSMFDHLEAPA